MKPVQVPPVLKRLFGIGDFELQGMAAPKGLYVGAQVIRIVRAVFPTHLENV